METSRCQQILFITLGTHVVDKDGAKNRLFGGQRTRLMQTMAGNGRMAPVFATMTGLSEDKSPPDTSPSGTCFLEASGLCVGASDVCAEGTGTVALARKDARIMQRGNSSKSAISGHFALLSCQFGKWTVTGIPLLLFRTVQSALRGATVECLSHRPLLMMSHKKKTKL